MCTEETKIQFTFPLEIKIWWVTTSKLRYHTEAIWWGVKARENCQLDDLLEHLIGQSKVTCVWIYPQNHRKLFCKKYLGIKKTPLLINEFGLITKQQYKHILFTYNSLVVPKINTFVLYANFNCLWLMRTT